MNTVLVKTSREYPVHIGTGLLEHVGAYARQLKRAQAVCLVSESTVYPLYGEGVKAQLESEGFSVYPFVFPAGEASKNGQTFLQLVSYMAQCQLTRTDLLVALGGGVTGDLAGFAAASFLRGIPFVQIPTTLLAAVDSSVGGKTAIDLPVGKNLVGAFYQPSLVVCDPACLDTLPVEIFRDGCAEVIKYAILYDPELFAHLEKHGLAFCREEVITRCVQLKRDVVCQDEFDTGARMKLNLGHTIGHGVEALSQFTCSHGKAVAIGIAIVTRACVKSGMCSQDDGQRILRLLETFGLPTSTDFSAQALYACTLSDKKRMANTVNLICPREIGGCDIVPTPVSQLQSFIEAGL